VPRCSGPSRGGSSPCSPHAAARGCGPGCAALDRPCAPRPGGAVGTEGVPSMRPRRRRVEQKAADKKRSREGPWLTLRITLCHDNVWQLYYAGRRWRIPCPPALPSSISDSPWRRSERCTPRRRPPTARSANSCWRVPWREPRRRSRTGNASNSMPSSGPPSWLPSMRRRVTCRACGGCSKKSRPSTPPTLEERGVPSREAAARSSGGRLHLRPAGA